MGQSINGKSLLDTAVDDFNAVPSADSADNVVIADVIGNKTDTIAGTSTIALSKLIASILGALDDAAASGVVTDVDTAIAYLKQLVTAELAAVTERSAILAQTVIIERHLHYYARWFGVAVTPNLEIHVADRAGDAVSAFQIDAGNNDWGSWVQILGSSDTPVVLAMPFFDLHKLQFPTVERDETYIMQIAFGATGADGLSAGDFTEEVYTPGGNKVRADNVLISCERIAAGTKAWARCKCPGQDTATMDFYIGLHEYLV